LVDGGTLEHVFHYPTALKNAMEMVKVGGRLFLITPTNNYCGHGFFQFSPELFYRTLLPENGFVVERMIAFQAEPGSQWYEVTDPAALRKRVIMVTSAPVLLMVRARRTHEAEIFATTPQQSDYAGAWDRSGAEAAATALPTSGAPPRRSIPRRLLARLRPWSARGQRGWG
jgi:hypothetical protein